MFGEGGTEPVLNSGCSSSRRTENKGTKRGKGASAQHCTGREPAAWERSTGAWKHKRKLFLAIHGLLCGLIRLDLNYYPHVW
jgi:hypothetical protein